MKPLKTGDKIAIISPAGAVEEAQLSSTLSLIEAQGFQPVLGQYALKNHYFGYAYAGTEQERATDLNWALNDESIAAIWATRGGYGCQHLLPYLRLDGFRRQPKWYIGYSDNTVVQSFLMKHHYPSLHGQTIKTASFGGAEEGYQQIFNILKGGFPDYRIEPHPLNRGKGMKGVLVGGNLALIYALLGTPYSFDFKEKILFIEDIGESFYALDRMLSSLDLAGVFKQIKGLIIGGMTNMGSEKENQHYEESFDAQAYEIIAHRVKSYDFPVLYAFPNGHIYQNLPLIIGGKIEVAMKAQVEVRQFL